MFPQIGFVVIEFLRYWQKPLSKKDVRRLAGWTNDNAFFIPRKIKNNISVQ